MAGKVRTAFGSRPVGKKKKRSRGIFHTLYVICYIIGARTIRRTRKTGILIGEVTAFLWKHWLVAPLKKAAGGVKFLLLDAPRQRREETRAWFRERYEYAGRLLNDLRAVAGTRKSTRMDISRMVDSKVYQYRMVRKEIARRNRRIWLGRVLTVMSVLLFAGAFAMLATSEVALKVTYAGKDLGFIANEQVYDTAVSDIEDRIEGVDSRYNFAATPLYTMSYTTHGSVLNETEFSDALLKAVMGDEVNYASGIYINGEFVMAVENAEPVETCMDSLLAPYLEEDPEANVSFLDDIEIRYGMYPVSRIRSEEDAVARLSQVSLKTVRYTCAKKDTVKTVAEKNGMSKATLLKYNPDIEDQISSGKTISVVIPTPFLRVKTTVTEVYTEGIPYKTVTKKNSSQYEGWSKITQNGKEGKREITANVFYVDGVEVGREILSSEVVREPTSEIKQVGSKTAPKTAPATSFDGITVTGKFLWPVDGGHISCRWMGYSGHEGLDIAAPKGTNIYAADGGVVVTVNKWNYSYGYHVVIDHGNGYKTRYAHMSKIAVSVGDKVQKGDVIGYVGTTGNSYGNHCHFEIMINGTRVNPEPYITSK